MSFCCCWDRTGPKNMQFGGDKLIYNGEKCSAVVGKCQELVGVVTNASVVTVFGGLAASTLSKVSPIPDISSITTPIIGYGAAVAAVTIAEGALVETGKAIQACRSASHEDRGSTERKAKNIEAAQHAISAVAHGAAVVGAGILADKTVGLLGRICENVPGNVIPGLFGSFYGLTIANLLWQKKWKEAILLGGEVIAGVGSLIGSNILESAGYPNLANTVRGMGCAVACSSSFYRTSRDAVSACGCKDASETPKETNQFGYRPIA